MAPRHGYRIGWMTVRKALAAHRRRSWSQMPAGPSLAGGRRCDCGIGSEPQDLQKSKMKTISLFFWSFFFLETDTFKKYYQE